MVEPKRKYIDVESTWKKKLLNKAAGPGGLLIVTMVQARDLRCCIDCNMMKCNLHSLHSFLS